MKDKTQKVLESLLEATRDREIEWEETVESGTYRVGFKSGLVQIKRLGDPQSPQAEYSYVIRNQDGREIESRVVDSSGPPSKPMATNPVWSLLHELYEAARGSILKTDETLDSMLEDIENGSTRPADEIHHKYDDDDIPF